VDRSNAYEGPASDEFMPCVDAEELKAGLTGIK
jgi:hypothetical protein